MVVTPKPDEEVRLEEIPAAIRRAGFVPGEMTIRARGSYVTRGSETAFRIRGWRSSLEVRGRATAPEGETALRARVDYSGGRVALDPLP